MLTLPLGVANAILVNFGCILVLKLLPIVRFKKRHWESAAAVFFIFLFSFMSLGLMIMYSYYEHGYGWIPPTFTRNWLLFYGPILSTQMFVSNILPYIGPLLKLCCRRGCCCCKRKNYKLDKSKNEEY
jgi:hypothetical protein